MNNYICPFCNSSFPLIPATYACYESSFFHSDTSNWDHTPENSVHLNFYKCPTCNKISLTITLYLVTYLVSNHTYYVRFLLNSIKNHPQSSTPFQWKCHAYA